MLTRFTACRLIKFNGTTVRTLELTERVLLAVSDVLPPLLSSAQIVSSTQERRVQQHQLLIYRWAQQALDTPPQDPILPLLWQRFFLLYLHRPVLTGG